MAKKYDVSRDNNPHNFANLPKEKLKKLSSKGGKLQPPQKKIIVNFQKFVMTY